jgi:hypothetical protein
MARRTIVTNISFDEDGQPDEVTVRMPLDMARNVVTVLGKQTGEAGTSDLYDELVGVANTYDED